MGEMADMFLEDVQTTEFLRDDFASGNMDILDAYEHGFVDEMGVEQEGMQRAWDDVCERTFNQDAAFYKTQLDFYRADDAKGREPTKRAVTTIKQKFGNAVQLEKKIKTLTFLLGFANHFYKYGKLSDKQSAIIETNWKGGSEKFLQSCSEYDMIKYLSDCTLRIQNILEEIE
jgi:hypothetical protein